MLPSAAPTLPTPVGQMEPRDNTGPAELLAGLLSGGSAESGDPLIGIDDVQKSLNRSRASVYRYTNTDPRNLNPPFSPRKLNPEFRSDQKEPLLFHPNEVARFARDVLRIKEVTVEVLNSPSTATQELLSSILAELQAIRQRLDGMEAAPTNIHAHRQQHNQARPAA
ncbi:MAG: resolvase [Cyanobacteria bacterium]|nr:resolvase [Cyanobacteriota bacterium]